jgi:hypothetical protein
MSIKHVLVALVLTSVLPLGATLAAENAKPAAPATFVMPRDFSWKSLAGPENLFWPGYSWFWNGPLDPDRLRHQLADMNAHGVRSVDIVPIPRNFHSEYGFNFQMEPDYLAPGFCDRVKIAVDEAARLGMNCWIKGDGGWPPGQAVKMKHPNESAPRYLAYENGKWTPKRDCSKYQTADLLDPQVTKLHLATTQQPLVDAMPEHFGRTIKFIFDDEPAYIFPAPGSHLPWTIGAEDIFRRRFGYDVLKKLDAFCVSDPKALTAEQKKVRVDLFDFWSRQFRDAFFLPMRDWCRQHGMAYCCQLGGEDEMIGAARYGFGHVMRPLRANDVPGIDVIWRQVFPGKQNHHFPKFASSAAHQNGTALTATLSFPVYGAGLTPAQMKWVMDYQYVRGMTLYLSEQYPLWANDHLLTTMRPQWNIGPLWDFLPDFHRYLARLGYVLACGQPDIETGLYYPVRDIWATGDPNDRALRGHDMLAQALLRRQVDFDIVDDDVLPDPTTRVENGRLAIGPMRYRTIVVGPTQWMAEASKKQLDAFQAAGGQVVHVDDLAQIDAAVAKIGPTVQLDPPSPDIRVLVRRWPGGGATFLFNEGEKPYVGRASIAMDGSLCEIEPATGLVRAVQILPPPSGRAAGGEGRKSEHANHIVRLNLDGWQSILLIWHPRDARAAFAPQAPHQIAQSIELADGWTARVDRQYVFGAHEIEIRPTAKPEFKPAPLGRWAKSLGLSEDFSGQVTYRRTVSVPEAMRGERLVLALSAVEYAARVTVDGREVGSVLWSPWRIELPPLADRAQFVLEIQVANTLANELTSQRVRAEWGKRKGPGWPSPYENQQSRFEVDSRGGGLLGPVRLQRVGP